MNDELLKSLETAIEKMKSGRSIVSSYSPVRQSLKKYKGNLTVKNDKGDIFYY